MLMSNSKRIFLITFITLLVTIFSVYVFKNVASRKEFRVVNCVTVGFTVIAIFKSIKLIAKELSNHIKK